MILEFGCKETEKVWKGEKTRRWNEKVAKIALRKLFMLHAAVNLHDLRIPPSNRLHPLKDDLKGYYSISINMQWQIIFLWDDGNATAVRIVDYH
ncbi:type II toxin-antitoxin system RelE/ParE family toxin [Fulvivirgaceae bacterium BMA12]|uniref:Type II toxin-antitoxin system RelE/ParE family toxin n=1 Tax=Agaribacillus aureus TaxID=3051825 RepID=A0ABT8L0G9_9BACT|nr:type II toxin-antitoxin system RelE/ParE family toxin [Fulvivirgaceae bacterium BMA12]